MCGIKNKKNCLGVWNIRKIIVCVTCFLCLCHVLSHLCHVSVLFVSHVVPFVSLVVSACVTYCPICVMCRPCLCHVLSHLCHVGGGVGVGWWGVGWVWGVGWGIFSRARRRTFFLTFSDFIWKVQIKKALVVNICHPPPPPPPRSPPLPPFIRVVRASWRHVT